MSCIEVTREGSNGPIARFSWKQLGLQLSSRRMQTLVEKLAGMDDVAECMPSPDGEYVDVKRGLNLTWGGPRAIEDRVRNLIDQTLKRAARTLVST